MTSKQQPGSGSSSGKPKPPKPSLPGEDPDLIYKTSSRVGGNVDVGGFNVGGNVSGDVVNVGGKVNAEDTNPQAAEPKLENPGINKQRVIRAISFLVSAGFVLMVILLTIYIFMRYFLR